MLTQPQNAPGPQQPVRPGSNEQQEMPDPYYDMAQQSILNEVHSMRDVVANLQIEVAKKKADTATEMMKKLRPLSEDIYNEAMPERYRRPTFTKYNGDTNPWDHVTLFEIECGSIGNNDK